MNNGLSVEPERFGVKTLLSGSFSVADPTVFQTLYEPTDPAPGTSYFPALAAGFASVCSNHATIAAVARVASSPRKPCSAPSMMMI